MKIIKLILHRYKRLFLGDIETLELTPENKLSIILASNGAGKSSLLLQLTPLPANLTKDFREGGYKYIEIEHRSSVYKLISGVAGGKKHNYIVDGIELNPGGTLRVQVELVKEHFNITPHIHNILLGVSNFTTMSAVERKRWITDISHIDYSYPISVYNGLKHRHRDIVGGMRILQESIVRLTSSVHSDEELDTMRETIVNMEKLIEHTISLITHKSSTVIDFDNSIAEIERLNRSVRLLYSSDIQEVDTNKLSIDIDVIKSRIDMLSKDIDVLNGDITKIDNITIHDITKDVVISNIAKYNKEVEELSNNLILDVKYDSMDIVSNYFNNIYTDIVSVIGELSEYNNIDVSGSAVSNITNNIVILDRQISSIDGRIKYANIELEQLVSLKEDSNKVVCNKCDNSWYLNYDEEHVSVLNRTIESYGSKVTNLKDSRDKLKTDMIDVDNKLSVINRIKSMVNNTVILKPVWSYVLADINLTKDDTSMLLSKVENVGAEIRKYESITELLSEITDSKKVLNDILITEQIKTEINTTSKDSMVDKLSELTTTKINLLNELDVKVNTRRDRVKLDTVVEELSSCVKRVYSDKDNYLIELRNNHLRKLVTELKGIHIELVNKVNDVNNINSKIDTDNKALIEYKKKEKMLKLLLKELSPSEGLIAKSINSFLNVFLEDINKLINSVWSYDMRILPCEITEADDLDYKFKVLVDNKEVIDDIGKTSSSMKEMIDLAFRIMFMKYGGLQDTPLILDEFGRTFDSEHRITAYNVVNEILGSSFTQIYMVSHFESMYGRFSNSDICILNKVGVDMSTIDKYNTTLKLR